MNYQSAFGFLALPPTATSPSRGIIPSTVNSSLSGSVSMNSFQVWTLNSFCTALSFRRAESIKGGSGGISLVGVLELLQRFFVGKQVSYRLLRIPGSLKNKFPGSTDWNVSTPQFGC